MTNCAYTKENGLISGQGGDVGVDIDEGGFGAGAYFESVGWNVVRQRILNDFHQDFVGALGADLELGQQLGHQRLKSFERSGNLYAWVYLDQLVLLGVNKYLQKTRFVKGRV